MRRLLLAAAAGSALLAVWIGLSRAGLPVGPAGGLHPVHGPLFVLAFLGTLIALERAVGAAALGVRFAFAPAVLFALGAGAVLFVPAAAPFVFTAAALALAALLAAGYRAARTLPAALEVLAAIVLSAANLRWALGGFYHEVVPGWAGFLLATIAAERMERARFATAAARPLARAAAAAGFALAAAAAVLPHPFSARAAGAAFLVLGAWILRHDPAVRAVRSPDAGYPFYAAALLSAGCLWLLAAGALWIGDAFHFVAGPRYDAMVHAFFLGFVFSMIFAHAPVVAGGVLGVPAAFHPVLWFAPLLLHSTLVLRLLGDYSGDLFLRRLGAGGNAAAILSLPLLLAYARGAAEGEVAVSPRAAGTGAASFPRTAGRSR